MKKAIISRTIKANTVKALSVNLSDRTVEEKTIVIPAKYNTIDSAFNFIRKNDSTVVSVLSVDTIEKLVGMYESDFVKNATAFSERSKECRGMVSKEVTEYSAHIMAVDSDRKVVDLWLHGAGDEKQCRRYCADNGYLFVQLVAVDTAKQLYAMPVDKFEQLARPMKDRFTLA